MAEVKEFIRESNRIEGILREPSDAEVLATEDFISRPDPTLHDLRVLVSVYQPDAVIRDKATLNVRVGSHIAPLGGNGRSGRALWAWQMLRFGWRPGLALGFLHAFYYQTLEHGRAALVTGFNMLGLPPSDGKVVGIVHEDGQLAIDTFYAKHKDAIDELRAPPAIAAAEQGDG